jgi:membrane fusion protein, multidrug efflux system
MLRELVPALFLIAACGSEKAALPAVGEAAAPVLGVRVTKPKESIGPELVRVSGVLRAKQESVLSAPATGTIARLFVQVGDRVKKGQALVQLDTSDVELQVDIAKAARSAAEAGLEVAATELERVKQLRSTDAAPVAVLDRTIASHKQAAAGLAQADAALRVAQESLRDHTLRAPFDGVITQRLKSIGETVAMMPPTSIIAIVDSQNLEVRAQVPESIVDLIGVGVVAHGLVSPSGKPFDAKVTSVGAVVDPATRTVEVLADLTSPISKEMRPSALVALDLSELAKDEALAGLYLPAQAVHIEGERRFVFVVQDGVATEREITVEPVTPGLVRVRQGIEAKDEVVVEGQNGLKSGTKVRVANEAS